MEWLYDDKPSTDEVLQGWAKILTNASRYLWLRGSYATAQEIATKALVARESVLGLDDPLTLTSVSNLALVLRYQGKYGEAEKLNRRALEGREKELGVQHPHTLTSVYCLVYLLHKRRRYEEAAKLYQRACNGYQQRLRPQHPTAVACLKHFTAMQQEADRERPGIQGRWLTFN
ncbi:hypothetical protein LTS18_005168 [Coniosporium uncinatum]|uniref:Uncharacterized protein n=1 Tax=Coniosporium uncinatum TaxID=93489 RepID=A0ACC3DB07_9PEZI|nr:hypothetical protein LTS18_005168 [Coniosporium uncinatum]